MNEPINIQELSLRTALPLRWLKAEALAGRIPCLRIGKRLLFNLTAVQAALATRAAVGEEVAAR